MYILLIIVVMINGGVNTEHLYFEDALSCNTAAKEVESHNERQLQYKLKAFCVKGD